MALDISVLMAMRAEKGKPEERLSRKQAAERQIKMFEEIEDGGACRCPACMGLALQASQHVFVGDRFQTDEKPKQIKEQ